ncbi:unnamed protein product [Darwinula stevensoni]|uniref:Anoctamin n=1 Tax=Darwinula stevensoni TaxID=69355 RepID=A0A7R9A1K8_9CRUS|nr:unnamed protein product [Darwinula stevensoni]CAG0886850.1 unnamed protein product [Darwinula stevensoni]
MGLEETQSERQDATRPNETKGVLMQNSLLMKTVLDGEGYPAGGGSESPGHKLKGSVMEIARSWELQQPVAHIDSLYFRDKTRQIDYIITYMDDKDDEDDMKQNMKKRESFQHQLEEEGLELELEHKALEVRQKTRKSFYRRLTSVFDYDHSIIPSEPEHFSAGLQNDKDLFLKKVRDEEFSQSQRNYIVYELLRRTQYDDGDETKFGIQRLISDGAYESCFPLHDGRYDVDPHDGTLSTRRLLYKEWARPGRWYKRQPLWLIRNYFGPEVGLYFTWLGFYTSMLFPAAAMGLICFIYGILSLKDNIPSFDICNKNTTGNYTMCPLCDHVCDFWKLSDSCNTSKFAFLFDNAATVVLAVFMAFWGDCHAMFTLVVMAATLFLELWERKQAVVAWEWDLEGFEEEEEPRPEYEAKVKTTRLNPVTLQHEPYVSRYSRCMRLFTVSSFILFLASLRVEWVLFEQLFLVLAAVFGVIVYRLTIIAVLNSSQVGLFKSNAKTVASVTAAIMNLIVIIFFNWVRTLLAFKSVAVVFASLLYNKVAEFLTNMELPRTQTDYEDSYTFKMFVFKFINFYSSLFYIAFFKARQSVVMAVHSFQGRFYGHPGDKEARDSFRYDLCDPAGCLYELCIQLCIIMVGKQALNNFTELALPVTQQTLKPVIQFGFVTLFVAAFPLAPLFALLNNLVELRLDAYNFVCNERRVTSKRVQDIGAWSGILKAVTYIAVICNAFVIAYTTDFIPRMVYQLSHSSNKSLVGFVDASLSVFNTSDFQQDFLPDEYRYNRSNIPPTCRYPGYREPPNSQNPYGYSEFYWHILAARLIFVVVFELYSNYIQTGMSTMAGTENTRCR